VPKLQFVVRALAANSQSCHLYAPAFPFFWIFPAPFHPTPLTPFDFPTFPGAGGSGWVVLVLVLVLLGPTDLWHSNELRR